MIEDYKEKFIYAIDIKYTWFDSPHKDYTLKAYSRHNITIFDYDEKTN